MWTVLTVIAIGFIGLFLFGAWKVSRDYEDALGSVVGSFAIAGAFGFLAWAMWFGTGPLAESLADEPAGQERVEDEPVEQTATTLSLCTGLTARECAEIREQYNDYREDQYIDDRWDDYNR